MTPKQEKQQGQSILEYILISSLVGIFCLAAMKQLGTVLDRRTKELKSRIVESLKLEGQ